MPLPFTWETGNVLTKTALNDTIYHKARLKEVISYDDATLSGTPQIIRVVIGGSYYYAKVYGVISATVGISNDQVDTNDVSAAADATLSGTPKTAYLQTNGEIYFFQVYPVVSGSPVFAGTLEAKPNFTYQKTISGTPRIAKFLINSVPYYMKVYSNKN